MFKCVDNFINSVASVRRFILPLCTLCAKFRSKFDSLRKEIKADIRKQHDLYVNNLVGDIKANPRDFYRYINSQKKEEAR